jgi:hypothetical protein
MKAPTFGHSTGFTARCEFCYKTFPTIELWEVPYDDGTEGWWAMCNGCHEVTFGPMDDELEAE